MQRVLMPGSEAESWTVLGADQVPGGAGGAVFGVPGGDRAVSEHDQGLYYAHDLKDWFVFLTGRGLDWRAVTVDDIAGFVAWLRLPPAARDGRVAVLPTVEHHCAATSVNRKLAALASFCEFHSRTGCRWPVCSP